MCLGECCRDAIQEDDDLWECLKVVRKEGSYSEKRCLVVNLRYQTSGVLQHEQEEVGVILVLKVRFDWQEVSKWVFRDVLQMLVMIIVALVCSY